MPKAKKKSSKLKNYLLIRRTIGILLIAVSLSVIFNLPSHKLQKQIPVESHVVIKEKAFELPTRVIVSKVGIDVEVTPSEIINGYWSVSDNSASYGKGSGIPGITGNTVIFAHARDRLFVNLRNVKKNDVIQILTKEKKFLYKVTEIKEVNPNDTSVISETKTEKLTLYTCSGWLDEKRFVVIGIPVGLDSIDNPL